MLKKLIALTILLYGSAVKGDVAIPGMPGSMSSMLIQPVTNPTYTAAAAAAQKAFWMQIGVTQSVDKYQGMFTKFAEKKAYSVWDDYVGLDRNKVFFIVGTGYALGVQHAITGTFNDPFFRNMTHDVAVNMGGGNFNIKYPF